jgi:Transposase domain (DUF772)
LKENIYFMWLSGNQQPDFRTINRFRSERMKSIIYEVFFSVVELLRQKGLVRPEDYYLDGTKIEANANRYSFVRIKAVHKYDEKLNEKYRKIAYDIERVLEGELQQESLDLDEQFKRKPVTSKEIQETMKKVEEHLKKIRRIKR